MILDYERKEFSDIVLYASINVFYLKILQYEKYQLKLDFDSIHNLINHKLDSLKTCDHNRSFNSISDMFKYSLVAINSIKELSNKMLRHEFMLDITSLQMIDEDFSKELMSKIS